MVRRTAPTIRGEASTAWVLEVALETARGAYPAAAAKATATKVVFEAGDQPVRSSGSLYPDQVPLVVPA